MDLEDSMFSEMNQTQKQKYHMILHIPGILKNIFKKKLERENKTGYQSYIGEWEGNGKIPIEEYKIVNTENEQYKSSTLYLEDCS